jgi:hypothetical protein
MHPIHDKKEQRLHDRQTHRNIDRPGQRLPSDEQPGGPFSGSRCPGLRSPISYVFSPDKDAPGRVNALSGRGRKTPKITLVKGGEKRYFSIFSETPYGHFQVAPLTRSWVAPLGRSSTGLAEKVGPILLGFKKSVHVLHRGSELQDIINMAAIAAMDAREKAIKQGS